MVKAIKDTRLIYLAILFLWVLSIPFKNAIFQIASILMLLAAIFHIFRYQNQKIVKLIILEVKNIAFWFTIFVLCMLLSNFLNPYYITEKSWYYAYMFFLRYGVMFVVICYFYQQNIFTEKLLYLSMFIAFGLVACTGFYQCILDSTLLETGVSGTLKNRNNFGLAMGMGLVLSITLLNYQKKIAFPLIGIFTFFMIFSFSRSSWVATVCAFSFFVAGNFKKIRKIYLFYFIVFMIFLLVLYFQFEGFQHRFHQLIEGNSSSRLTIWSHLISQIGEHPFFGYGIKSQTNLSDEFLTNFPDPHNLLLETLLYTGGVGLICLSIILVLLIKHIMKEKQFYLLPVFSYFLVVTQFDFDIFTTKELMSFFMIFTFFIYKEKIKLCH